jgi:hypothetical protein
LPTAIEIIGVYPIDAQEPCHLVELWVRRSTARVDLGLFTQEDSTQPQSNWQVPYDEKILDASGSAVIKDAWQDGGDAWKGDVRLAFFFHYLRSESPLLTPFGEVVLPTPTPLPARLRSIKYDPP